ncbi:hypothetical protein WDW37_21635 [Bdellovibrionota bacterium FG-1]
MTYREKFTASEERAHYQIIATKILREMTELRSKAASSTTSPRRWIWELIQNAKDVHGGQRVKVEVSSSLNGEDAHVTFRHNGQPFSAENIRFLIEQISTKDRKKDDSGKQKTTGKFGTGFLSTHLLSEAVFVQAVVKEPDLDYRQFTLFLDRRGDDLETITEAVRTAKGSMEQIDSIQPYRKYVEGAFNTEFRYPLSDDLSRKIAANGLADFVRCIPYTLVFVKEIENASAISRRFSVTTRQAAVAADGEIELVSVSVESLDKSNSSSTQTLAILRKNFTTIAIPVKELNGSIHILEIGAQVPRLFCDFPLIGTERLPLPIVVNNPNFGPTDPRDGVFLNHTQRTIPQIAENKLIIQEAVESYLKLLDHASESGWKNLHLLANIQMAPPTLDWLESSWYRDAVLNPIRKVLIHSKIVRTASDDALASILSPDGTKYIWFPKGATKEIRDRLWLCASHWFSHQVPKRSDVELWNDLVWDDCGKLSTSQFAQFVELKDTLEKLQKVLPNKDVHEWLADFYELLKLEETEVDSLLNKHKIFPNQNGVLCKRADLSHDAGDIPEDFKDILALLGSDVRSTLMDREIDGHFEALDTRDKAYAVREITSEVQEKTNDRDGARSFRPAFRKLLAWFGENSERAKALFPTLYKQKHLLYDDEEILENIEKAEQLAALLTEFDVKSVTELRAALATRTGAILPITQEILVNMGISSVEEWTEAIKDKDLAGLFSHESTPTTDMFVYAQSLIAKAKKTIIDHLRTQPNYDLADLDETAPTVLAGILKDGQSINVVTRPAYNGEVIIYYGSERDVLDYEHAELWVDDGAEPRQITLGHILKTAGIRKFPI